MGIFTIETDIIVRCRVKGGREKMEQKRENTEHKLVEYFRGGIKTDSGTFNIGLELEHIIVDCESGQAIEFYGENGVEQVLEELSPYCQKKIYSDDYLVGLEYKDFIITLEPAAQMEISIYPQSNIKRIEQIYREFRKKIEAVINKYGYSLAQVGYQPQSRAAELSLIPKERYKMMDRYFEKIGKYGREMMRGTASTQVAIDYYSEEDFILKYKTAYIVAPIIQFLFDNTPFYEGKVNEKRMIREEIWKHVDRKRVDVWEKKDFSDMDFKQYARFVLDTPIIVNQTEECIEYSEKTVKAVYENRKDITADDIEHMLSMVFPMVRLKNYIEIRYADSMSIEKAISYVAFIKGLFAGIDETNRYFQMLHVDHIAMVEKAYEVLRSKGRNAEIYGKPFEDIVKDLYKIVKRYVSEEEYEYGKFVL